METSNIGLTGMDSLRIAGMLVSELPIAEQAAAKAQLPLAEDTQRQNRINNILKRAPTQRVDYLKSRVKECQANIKKISDFRVQNAALIAEYTVTITRCEMRDKQIAQIADDDPAAKEKISRLLQEIPPYSIPKMRDQITQFGEAVNRCEEVIEKEYAAIAELQGVLALCERRDGDLRALGAKIGA